MRLRKIPWLILFLVAVLWLPVGSMMAQIFSGTNQSRVMGRANRGANYFAIMGHIKHPMAYQLPTSAPSLVDFIRFAGGVLKTTTGEIRIVRGERVVQQTMLTSSSTIKLMPGDLVIVDGGREGRGTIFRGGNNRADSTGEESGRLHQIALIGVRPYPVIMQMTPDVATKRWILQQLRQDLSMASSVKVVSRRHFGAAPGIDTRLTDNTVLVFADGLINTAALPQLPSPFVAGRDRHADQKPFVQNQPPAPSAAAQLPLPITQPFPEGRVQTDRSATPTPPGYSVMPDARDSAESSAADPETTREILTHPGSVPLDERQSPLPGRAHVGDSGSAAVRRPPRTRSNETDRDDSVGFNPRAVLESETGDSEVDSTVRPEAADPEAKKPFVSQPDPVAVPVIPDSANRAETTELPLTPLGPGGNSTSTRTPVTPGQVPAVTGSRTTLPGNSANSHPQSGSSVEPAPTRAEPLNPPGPVNSLEPVPSSATPLKPVAEVPEMPHATPSPSLAAQSADELAGNLHGAAESAPAVSGTPAGSGLVTADTDAGIFTHGESDGSRIVPHNEEGTSWPLIAAGFIGSLGFLAAFSLLLSITGPAPPTTVKAAKSDREWLDDIINDELPVEQEPVAEPAVSELFGRPTDAPTLRLDAAHRSVPRPHFLDRGDQTGIGQPRTPEPDIPAPDSKKPDDRPDDPPIVVPPRGDGSRRRTPDVPFTPAAGQQEAETAKQSQGIVEQLRQPVKEPEQNSPVSRPVFRIDSTHGSGVPSKRPARPASAVVAQNQSARSDESEQKQAAGSQAAKISVEPARSVAAGSDLLDRVLASVESYRKPKGSDGSGQKEQA